MQVHQARHVTLPVTSWVTCMQVIMNSLSGASRLYVGHNMKTQKVFMAIEGLTREAFQRWDPPIAQLKGIPSSTGILSVIVSCAGQQSSRLARCLWACVTTSYTRLHSKVACQVG